MTKEIEAPIFGDTNSHSCTNAEKLDEILERVKSIQISVDQNKTPLTLSPLAKPKDVKPSDEHLKQLLICRSIEEIIDVFDEFEYIPVDGYVICKLCVPDNITVGRTFVWWFLKYQEVFNMIQGMVYVLLRVKIFQEYSST